MTPPTVSQHLLRLPQVAGVAPANAGEEAARAATAGAVAGAPFGALAGEGLVAGMTRAAAGGATAAVTGQTFADQVPDQWKDVANTAGQIIGGLAVPVGEAAARSAARVVGGAVNMAAGPMSMQTPQPVIDPTTGQPFMAPGSTPENPTPVMATDKTAAAAGTKIASAAGMSPGELADAIPVSPSGGPMPGSVPGSTLTLGQTTGNTGILGLERNLRNQPTGRAAFTNQEASNNLARIASLDTAAPADASAAASQWFRTKLANMQAENEATHTAAQSTASSALEGAGVGPGLPRVDEIGATQQAALDALRQPAKAAASAALQAIDPEGKLAVDTTPVFDAEKSIRAGVGMGGRLDPAESAVLDAAHDMRGVNSFSDLRSLMGNTAGGHAGDRPRSAPRPGEHALSPHDAADGGHSRFDCRCRGTPSIGRCVWWNFSRKWYYWASPAGRYRCHSR